MESAAAHSGAEVEERPRQEPRSVGNANPPRLLDDVETVAAAAWSRRNEYWASEPSDDVLQRGKSGGARVRHVTAANHAHDRDGTDHNYEEPRDRHRSAALFNDSRLSGREPHARSVGSATSPAVTSAESARARMNESAVHSARESGRGLGVGLWPRCVRFDRAGRDQSQPSDELDSTDDVTPSRSASTQAAAAPHHRIASAEIAAEGIHAAATRNSTSERERIHPLSLPKFDGTPHPWIRHVRGESAPQMPSRPALWAELATS